MNPVLRMTWATLAAAAIFSAAAFAQTTIGPDAGAKARGEVTSSATFQRHAQDYSRMMYNSQQIQPAAAPAVVEKQAATVKENLTKSDEGLKAVKAAHAKDAEVVKLVDSILKHHANAASHCDMVAECCKKGDGPGKIADCCVDIHDELEAAKKDMDKLTKHLKIEELPIPKKQATKK